MLLSGPAPPSASAAGGQTSLVITAGQGLTVDSSSGTGSIPLTANRLPAAAPRTYFLPLAAFTAIDSTGTGQGWHLVLQATEFTASDGRSLPAASLTVTAPVIRCARGVSCTGRGAAPAVDGEYPAAIDTSTALTIASARIRTGMGTYDFLPGSFDGDPTHNLALTVPAGSTQASYTSMLSISIVSGP